MGNLSPPPPPSCWSWHPTVPPRFICLSGKPLPGEWAQAWPFGLSPLGPWPLDLIPPWGSFPFHTSSYPLHDSGSDSERRDLLRPLPPASGPLPSPTACLPPPAARRPPPAAAPLVGSSPCRRHLFLPVVAFCRSPSVPPPCSVPCLPPPFPHARAFRPPGRLRHQATVVHPLLSSIEFGISAPSVKGSYSLVEDALITLL